VSARPATVASADKTLRLFAGRVLVKRCTVGFVATVPERPGAFAIITAGHCFEGISRKNVRIRVGSQEKRDSVPGSLYRVDTNLDVAAFIIDPSQAEVSNEMLLDRGPGPRQYVKVTSVNALGRKGDDKGDRLCFMGAVTLRRICGELEKQVHQREGFVCLPFIHRGECVKVRKADVKNKPGDSGAPIFREWKRTPAGPEYQAVGILLGGVDNTRFAHISDVERVLDVQVFTGIHVPRY
jgi:hypothetical protein